jgi:hypothetical protein
MNGLVSMVDQGACVHVILALHSTARPVSSLRTRHVTIRHLELQLGLQNNIDRPAVGNKDGSKVAVGLSIASMAQRQSKRDSYRPMQCAVMY